VVGTGGFKSAGASGQLAKIEGSSGSSIAAVEPAALKTPAAQGNGGTSVMNGDLDELLDALQQEFRAEQLAAEE